MDDVDGAERADGPADVVHCVCLEVFRAVVVETPLGPGVRSDDDETGRCDVLVEQLRHWSGHVVVGDDHDGLGWSLGSRLA